MGRPRAGPGAQGEAVLLDVLQTIDFSAFDGKYFHEFEEPPPKGLLGRPVLPVQTEPTQVRNMNPPLDAVKRGRPSTSSADAEEYIPTFRERVATWKESHEAKEIFKRQKTSAGNGSTDALAGTLTLLNGRPPHQPCPPEWRFPLDALESEIY